MLSLEDVDDNLELSIDSINFFSSDVITDLQSATYQVYVRDDNNCTVEVDIDVTDAPELEVDFPTYAMDCSVTSVIIEPVVTQSASGLSYAWNNGDNASEIVVGESGLYTVEVSDKCNTLTYDWDLEFIEVEEPHMYTPNIFNPGSSNLVNKVFKPLVSDEIIAEHYQMQVYDRWGNVVCATSDIAKGWDGQIGNAIATYGVYLWSYEVEIEHCGELYTYSKKGSVTIVK